MNFLELCQTTRMECGIQGSNQPVTVTGQSGILKRIVNWVKDADLYIQRIHPDWDFLWREYSIDTVQGSITVPMPDDFGIWDVESFAYNRGKDTGSSLAVMDFREWRKNQSNKENTRPTRIAILPNQSLSLEFPADGIYTIYANYWKAPVSLTTNTDTPLYPLAYHRAIIAKAKMFFFEDIESINNFQLAEKELNEIITNLESNQLSMQASLYQMNPAKIVVRPI